MSIAWAKRTTTIAGAAAKAVSTVGIAIVINAT